MEKRKEEEEAEEETEEEKVRWGNEPGSDSDALEDVKDRSMGSLAKKCTD